jgi:YggT family protein
MAVVLASALRYFCNFLYIIILARVIFSWFPVARRSKAVRILFALTEPILSPIRSVLRKSPLGGAGVMIDLSPLVALLLIQLTQSLLLQIIFFI